MRLIKKKKEDTPKKETMITMEISLTFIHDGEVGLVDKAKYAEQIKKELNADDVVVKSTKLFILDK